jgi:Flp pilus assembly pilin Flp
MLKRIDFMRSLIVLRRFIADEAGVSMAEYSVLIAILALGAVVALTSLGGAVSGLFAAVANFIATLNFV